MLCYDAAPYWNLLLCLVFIGTARQKKGEVPCYREVSEEVRQPPLTPMWVLLIALGRDGSSGFLLGPCQ